MENQGSCQYAFRNSRRFNDKALLCQRSEEGTLRAVSYSFPWLNRQGEAGLCPCRCVPAGRLTDKAVVIGISIEGGIDAMCGGN